MARKKVAATRFGGVDIGGTKLHAIITDEDGAIVGSARMKSRPEKGFAGVMARVGKVLGRACESAETRLDALRAIGVGAPSPILPDGTAVNAPNMGWADVPLTDSLGQLLGRPVYALNDCNAGLWGEYILGAARGASSAVGLFVGTGIGGGVVVDGKLMQGENHQAAELGHTIVRVGGRRCGCGHRGCLEAYASKAAMARRAKREARRQKTLLTKLCGEELASLRSGALAEAYDRKDKLTVNLLHEVADYLGIGVGNMITVFGPKIIVIGGGVFEALGSALIDRVRLGAKAVTFPPAAFPQTEIRLAALGDDAVALGAMAWARQHHGAARA